MGRFQKGNPGGPGRPEKNYNAEECAKQTADTIRLEFGKHLPAFARGIAKAIANFEETGDIKEIDPLLNRILGKPKETIETTSTNRNTNIDVTSMKDLHQLVEQIFENKSNGAV
jgi:hypothetical protein